MDKDNYQEIGVDKQMQVNINRSFMNSFSNANLMLENKEYAVIKTPIKTRLT